MTASVTQRRRRCEWLCIIARAWSGGHHSQSPIQQRRWSPPRTINFLIRHFISFFCGFFFFSFFFALSLATFFVQSAFPSLTHRSSPPPSIQSSHRLSGPEFSPAGRGFSKSNLTGKNLRKQEEKIEIQTQKPRITL